MRYALIMAGGVGSRFWPSSRMAKPKQFLNLLGDRTMIQMTVDRIRPLFKPEHIFVITNDSYVSLVHEQLPEIPMRNIIGEVVAKNTAPCVALAATMILEMDPDASMVVLPADHHMRNPDQFLRILESALAKAESGPHLVTVGITPHRPETGYGYIQQDDQHFEDMVGNRVYKVRSFAEKPDIHTAIRFLQSGDFLWNSGMFIWRADTILNEFRRHLPEMAILARQIPALDDADFKKAVDAFYRSVNSISIDYGIMEKAETVHVVPGEFGWSDVGSWQAIYELADKDANLNATQGTEALFVDSAHCFVKSSSGRLIAMVGLDGVALVETDDTLMVCRIEAAQDVKKVVDSLKGTPNDHLR
jgi:mannose-1-phosphate guanylyltransferase